MRFSEDNFLLKLTGMAGLQSNKDTHDEGKKKNREVEKYLRILNCQGKLAHQIHFQDCC